jgi:adenosylmethionine-8-amino-7-oxononanoate aminotransferase
LHGHAEPTIAKAIYAQALKLEHVIFAGFTHDPAVSLAEKILQQLPDGFRKVFYSDNGSTAVEIALKMAYQYWLNKGEKNRKRFIAFEKGYHGDTFGAMSVGKQSGFYSSFEDLLFSVDMFAYPATWLGDELVIEKEQHILLQLENYLKQHGLDTAALIIEPLVQGASGMRMCTSRFLTQLEALVRSYGVLIIYDEVMTGFGRTGEIFACKKASTTPDIICLAKGISGGFLPMAATICHQEIYENFLGDTFARALAHGHSFTANPLGCAAGLASLELLLSPQTQIQLAMIEKVHQEQLGHLVASGRVEKPRFCGTIGAFELKSVEGYGSQSSRQLQQRFIELGLLVRPLGNVIYFMPPYCITETELRTAYKIVTAEIQGVTA